MQLVIRNTIITAKTPRIVDNGLDGLTDTECAPGLALFVSLFIDRPPGIRYVFEVFIDTTSLIVRSSCRHRLVLFRYSVDRRHPTRHTGPH